MTLIPRQNVTKRMRSSSHMPVVTPGIPKVAECLYSIVNVVWHVCLNLHVCVCQQYLQATVFIVRIPLIG